MLELLRVRLIGSSIFRGSNYREFELSGIRVIGVRVIGDSSYRDLQFLYVLSTAAVMLYFYVDQRSCVL